MNNETRRVPEEEILRQKEIMARVRGMLPAGRKYHIVTLGCQMNVRDSETLAGMLTEMGFTEAATREEADLILYNTCCVRENAENKALGNVIWLKELKKDKPELIICVGGLHDAGGRHGGIADSPVSLYRSGVRHAQRVPVPGISGKGAERPRAGVRGAGHRQEPSARVCRRSARPVFRLRQHHVRLQSISARIASCPTCVAASARARWTTFWASANGSGTRARREIMLLGQNVNSYMGGGAKFAELLYRVDALDIPARAIHDLASEGSVGRADRGLRRA